MLGLLAVTECCLLSLATQSRLSILMRAVRDDEDAAAQVGVRTFRVKLGVFMLGSFLMSTRGALQAYSLRQSSPMGCLACNGRLTCSPW